MTGGETSWTCCADKFDDPCSCNEGTWKKVTCNENGDITGLALASCVTEKKVSNV